VKIIGKVVLYLKHSWRKMITYDVRETGHVELRVYRNTRTENEFSSLMNSLENGNRNRGFTMSVTVGAMLIGVNLVDFEETSSVQKQRPRSSLSKPSRSKRIMACHVACEPCTYDAVGSMRYRDVVLLRKAHKI
jgi:hypothetical protein